MPREAESSRGGAGEEGEQVGGGGEEVGGGAGQAWRGEEAPGQLASTTQAALPEQTRQGGLEERKLKRLKTSPLTFSSSQGWGAQDKCYIV